MGRGAVTLAIDNIGLLVTNDAEQGEGVLGLKRDVALVVEGQQVVAVEPAGVAADTRIDAAGRCVIPGFVDSHTHLVFAGDRGDEFVARMAGAPYQAGGILTYGLGHTGERATTSSGKGSPGVAPRPCATASRGSRSSRDTGSPSPTNGACSTSPPRPAPTRRCSEPTSCHLSTADATDDYVDLVCTEMIAAAAGACRWVDAFCEQGAFDADQCRAVLTAAERHGLGTRLHANQLGHGPGVQLAVELGCASADHCTYLTDADIEALAASTTIATFLPATDFSTRQPYPDARRVIDAGATVAIATNCNPGSSYTSSMAFCIALAVRDMRMTIEEALLAATVGGAEALRRPELGRLTPGSRADAVVLNAPSYTHLVYRPGMQLVAGTLLAGHPSVELIG